MVLRSLLYQYDAKLRQRLKTVKLIVERTDWTPPPPRYTADTLVPLHIEAADMPMRALAKGAGGRWNPEKRLWFAKPVPSGYECHSANTGYMAGSTGTPLENHIQVDDTGEW